MSKYGKYTGGQVEAILNKVCCGDESILDALLRDEVEFIIVFTGKENAPVREDDTVVCGAFGNRCTICGSYFDEGNICNNKHELGHRYGLVRAVLKP